MRIELKATIVAATASLSAFAITFGLSLLLRSTVNAHPNRAPETSAASHDPASAADARPGLGRKLFENNCAHCHGDDARGDEGPNLHNLALSDAGIARRIRDGIKGEMPRFGSKLGDEDIKNLIAYLRTLKE